MLKAQEIMSKNAAHPKKKQGFCFHKKGWAPWYLDQKRSTAREEADLCIL